jgi:hypothetical protein
VVSVTDPYGRILDDARSTLEKSFLSLLSKLSTGQIFDTRLHVMKASLHVQDLQFQNCRIVSTPLTGKLFGYLDTFSSTVKEIYSTKMLYLKFPAAIFMYLHFGGESVMKCLVHFFDIPEIQWPY